MSNQKNRTPNDNGIIKEKLKKVAELNLMEELITKKTIFPKSINMMKHATKYLKQREEL